MGFGSAFLLVALSMVDHRAEAGVVGNFCVPATQIDEKTSFCDDNKYFVQYADRCIDRLEEEVKNATGNLTKKFAPSQGKKQQAAFSTSLKDYNFSSKALANLIAMADRAILDVKDYEKNLVLPEDWDNPEALNGMDLDEWADELDCYGGSGESITRQLKILSDMRDELLAAKKIADSHEATSGGRESNLNQASTLNKAASAAKGNGTVVPIGKHPVPSSDISGTKKAIDNANKSKQVIQKTP